MRKVLKWPGKVSVRGIRQSRLMFEISNRRYIGSKASLSEWIFDSIPEAYKGGTFFDVFAGTGVVAMGATKFFSKLVVNDLLYSNEVIYKAFFGTEKVDEAAIHRLVQEATQATTEENYFSINFGGRFFHPDDARQIGWIRNRIEEMFPDQKDRTRNVALASLLYSADRSANTVGHYEAFLKSGSRQSFKFELVRHTSIPAAVHRMDANDLVREIRADVAYVDPPYNSRQYSRFYHVLETLVKWDEPELSGVALKPPVENTSRYCKVEAPDALADLIKNLDARFIIISYNNTYNSKSSSSRNKIELDEIANIARMKGKVKTLEQHHKHFNAGKTDFKDHVEYLFLIEVGNVA